MEFSSWNVKWFFVFQICATGKIKSSWKYFILFLITDFYESVLNVTCWKLLVLYLWSVPLFILCVQTHGHEVLSNGHLTNVNRSTHQWLFNSSIVLHICVCVCLYSMCLCMQIFCILCDRHKQFFFFFLCMWGYRVCKHLYFHKTMHPRMWKKFFFVNVCVPF